MQPQTKALEELAALSDPRAVLSEFALHRLDRLTETAHRSGDIASPVYHTHKGEISRRLGKLLDSEVHYRRAVETAGEHWAPLADWAKALFLIGKFEDGVTALLKAVDLPDGENWYVLNHIAIGFFETGRFDGAEDALSMAIEATDLRNTRQALELAAAAAHLEQPRIAVAAYAHFVCALTGVPFGQRHPRDILRDAPPELVENLDFAPELAMYVHQATMERPVIDTSGDATQEEIDEVRTILRSMAPLRLRANTAVLHDEE